MELLKHTWLTVPDSTPPTGIFSAGFETGDACPWSASEPFLCSPLDSPQSPNLVWTDEQEYAFDVHGNINEVKIWTRRAAQSPRTMATSAFTNRLDAPLALYDSRGNLNRYSTVNFMFDRLNRFVRRHAPGEYPYQFFSTADDERIVTLVEHRDSYPEQRWTLREFGGKVLRELGTEPGERLLLRRAYVHRGQSPLEVLDQEDNAGPEALHFVADTSAHRAARSARSAASPTSGSTFPAGRSSLSELPSIRIVRVPESISGLLQRSEVRRF